MLAVDWGEATKIAAVGFGMVISILGILAVAIWIVGMALRKSTSKGKEESSQPK